MIKATKIGTNAVSEFDKGTWERMKGCFVTIGTFEYDRYGWIEVACTPLEAKKQVASTPLEANFEDLLQAFNTNDSKKIKAAQLYAFIEHHNLAIDKFRNLPMARLFEATVIAYKATLKDE